MKFGTILLLAALPLGAEEGMWPLGQAPFASIEAALGVKIDERWIDEVRAATVRVNDLGSGSFVTADGLVLTNHHVVADKLDALSRDPDSLPEWIPKDRRDITRKGFAARSREQEIPIDVEVRTPLSWEDVTARVDKAMRGGGGARAVVARRDAETAAILAECGKDILCEVLKQNGGHWLYRYRSYTNVRLVFAPAADTAYFGGVKSDYAFPRFWLDVAFLRVYDDAGKPLSTPKHFRFRGGAREGEPVFTSGFPYVTDRFMTAEQMKLARDIVNPSQLKQSAALRDALKSYAALGEEKAREVQLELQDKEWDVHWREMMQPVLEDPALLARRIEENDALRAAVARLPTAERRAFAGVFERSDTVTALKRSSLAALTYRGLGEESGLASVAAELARYGAELQKPASRRAEGYRTPEELAERREGILAARTRAPELERRLLAARLGLAEGELGPEDPFVRAVLGGCSAESVACRAVEGTRLADPAFRASLLEDGGRAIRHSADPLLALARRARPHVERIQGWHARKVEAAEELLHELIARARRRTGGASAYPDANWGPRLSFGRVEGYEDAEDMHPFRTTLHGLFDRARGFGDRPPHRLDDAFARAAQRLNLGTPLNFTHSTDITGGNSGSAVIDADRNLVGILFDSNRPAVADYYGFHPDGRTISVDAAGILEALDKAYDMGWLARELTERAAPSAEAPSS